MTTTSVTTSPATRKTMKLHGRRVAPIAGIAAIGLIVSACGPSLSLVTVPLAESQAEITSKLFDAKNVSFDEPSVISVEGGRIDSVTVRAARGGERVGGSLADGGTGWKLDTSALEFGTKYKVTAKALDLRGRETSIKSSFKTFTPEKELTITTNVWDGATFGVGMPITVSFSEPVKHRAQIERRLEVTTDAKKKVVGAWSWDSDNLVTYRPKKYWPGHTKIKLNAAIKGVNAGDGAYAMDDATREFATGTENIMLVDSDTKYLTFKQDGRVAKRMPATLGKPGFKTRSGIKVLMSKERDLTMTSGTAEIDPEYYNVDVAVAMRLTWSGEFLHSAPWSVSSQGNTNVSHGCIGVNPANAEWIMANANIGDIVEVINTGRAPAESGNGITVWNESWGEWKAGSAL